MKRTRFSEEQIIGVLKGLLAREGFRLNHKKRLQIYREEGLKVRQGPNQRWSLDFVSDSLVCGRRFRILCVVDDFTRECLALSADICPYRGQGSPRF
jgi:transposase InsO family protein